MDRLTAQGQAFSTSAAAMYADRMTIRRKTSTKGATGGNIPGAPLILATNVPCRVRPASASEKEIAGATQAETALLVKAPAWHGSDLIEIDSRCEIQIAARGGMEAQTLNVVAPLPNQGLTFAVVGTTRA